MLRLTDYSQVPHDFGPTVATLGNFDGVHGGHTHVLRQVVAEAERRGARSVAVTFDPHPLEVLHPERAPAQITALEDRLELMEGVGLDATLVLSFDLDLAAQTPEQFVRECFVEALGVCAVIVGADTRFGVKNSGDITTLRELGDELGFDVLTLEDVGSDGAGGPRWSSTAVRGLLHEGRVEEAAEILGRAHRVRGKVVHGLQRGRELGFPTANLAQDARGMIPADGVYAGWLVRHGLEHQHRERRMPAAVSVGTNPTFDNPVRTVEAYVLDRTDLDLYDEQVSVEFVHRLRGNDWFDSVEALIEQMHRDVAQARAILDRAGS